MSGGKIGNIEENKLSGISVFASSTDIYSKMVENLDKF